MNKRSILKMTSVLIALLLLFAFTTDTFGQRKPKKIKYKGDESPYGHDPQPDGCKQFKEIDDCPRIGCGGKPTEHPLNQRKNIDRPSLASARKVDFEQLRTMKMPAAYDYSANRQPLIDAGEGDIVTTVAYMTAIRFGSQESCNCKLWLAKDTDNHMVLLNKKVINKYKPKDWEKHSFTAEFSPRGKKGKTDFRVSVIDRLIKDDPRQRLLVRLTGSLMFDDYHEKKPLALGRETNWELHPIWEFEYCPTNKCTLDDDKGWKRIN